MLKVFQGLRVSVCISLSALVLAVVMQQGLQAQFTSTVQGDVVDQSQAFVPEVTITLTNVDTRVSIETVTNSSGVFRFPNLPPGRYQLRASKTGFQTVVQENIVLESGRVQSVPVTLPVGAVTEQITVTEAVTQIETSNPKIGTTISNAYVQNIPMSLRNIYNVVALAPGVTGFAVTNGDSFQSISRGGASANGMRMYSNGYYVDGSPVNDMADGGGAKLSPNPDSVEEVQVSTNDYSAEWGRSAGVLTQVVSKTGTNDYHGSLFWFHRNNKLTSRTFLQSTPNALTGRTIPVSNRNDFGGSFGGPIVREKTFFFFSFNELRERNSFANLVTIETPQFVNFMKQNLPNNLSTKLLTDFAPSSSVSALQANTIRTVSSLDATCQGMNSLGMPCDLPVLGQAVFSDANARDGRQWNVRIDQNFNNGNDRIYANIYQTTRLNEGKNARPGFSTLGINFDGNGAKQTYISGNYTKIFSPTIINEMSASIVRVIDGSPCNNCRVPSINITGMQGFGNGWAPGVFITRDINWQNVLSINRGTHFFKMGANYFVDQEPLHFTGPLERPNFSFLNVFDFAKDAPISEGGINFDPRTGSTDINNERDFRLPYYGFFFQDDWKVKRNLTINWGLRWEFNRNPTDKADLLATMKLGPGSTMWERITGMSVTPVDGLYEEVPKKYFAPRLGIAWDPTGSGKISVRSGFGIFYDTMLTKSTFDRMQLNPPNFAAGSVRSDDPTTPNPIFKLGRSDTRPFGFELPGLRAGLNEKGGPIGVRAQIAGAPPVSQLPYSVNWFWGVQYALPGNWVVEGNYSGSRGVHLWTITDRNRCAGCGVARLSPFFAVLEYHDNGADSIYHGGSFVLKKRFSEGIGFETAYSFGKTIDVISGGTGIGGAWADVYDAYNFRAQRGLSQNDYPQRLSASYVWELPKLASSNGLVRGVLGGWQTSSIIILQSGRPHTVRITNRDYNNDAQFLDLPDAPSVTFGDWKNSDYVSGTTFKASDFPAPPAGRGGNLGRNTYRGPGLAQVDFSLIKNTQVPWFTTEPAAMQIRFEAYNLFNRVNINNWETNLASSSFGRATSSRDPRTIQLGLRIAF